MGCFSDMGDGTVKYYSHRTLQEDKRKCMVGLDHPDHSKSNTLEILHDGKEHMSAKALAERTKSHKGGNRNWVHDKASEPKHPYAASAEGSPKRHWSQRELQEQKTKLQTGLMRDVRPQSARMSRRHSDASIGSYSARSSMAGSEAGSQAGGMPKRKESCGSAAESCASPTMSQLLRPGDDVLSVVSWRDAIRQARPSSVPHSSHELFDARKRHHMTHIHSARGPGSKASSEVDPKMMAYQEPEATLNQTPELLFGTPRYRSQECMQLDKRRHVAPMGMTKRQVAAQFSGGESAVDSDIGGHAYEAPIPVNGSCTSKAYKSSEELRKHKKRHLVDMNDRKARNGVDLGMSQRSNSFSCTSGHMSHRELEQAKKLNIVEMSAARLHPGDGFSSSHMEPAPRSMRRASSDVSDTPLHAASPSLNSRSANDRNNQYLTTNLHGYGPGSRRAALDSIASSSDVGRCHSASKLARDKRHHRVEMPKTRPTPGEMMLPPESCVSESFVELESPRSIRSARSPGLTAPTPRSGQWTPQHM